MGDGRYTPRGMRDAVQGVLSGTLPKVGPSFAQEGYRPVQPTLAPRSQHKRSYSVVVTTDIADGSIDGPSGDRIVDYTVQITLMETKASTPEESLDHLYGYVDEVYRAMQVASRPGGEFGCLLVRFLSQGSPEEGDHEYMVSLTYQIQAVWPAS